MATLSGGHLAVDFASGAVPALLPFLALEFDLSYTATAVLMLAVLVSSSFVQPLFGLWSDRRGALWLLPGGVALAGVGTGLAAVAPSYGLVLVLVFLGGIGIAAYHPEGAKFAAYASGRKRASGMSYFNIGGNTGYALGPIVVTPLVALARARTAGWSRCCPSSSARSCCSGRCRRLSAVLPTAGVRSAGEGRDDLRAMSLLAVVIALRSVAWFGLLTFVPLWVVANGGTEGEGSRELSLMLVAGAVGTLVLGPVADRIGLRRTLVVTQAALPFLIAVFVSVGGAVGNARADARRPLRRRHVRDHDGAQPALPPAARRDGERALGRGRDGSRGRRGRRARGGRRRDRPRDRALRRGRGAGSRSPPLLLPAVAPGLEASARARAGRDRLGWARSIEPSVNEETNRMTAQEFFAELPGKADPAKTAGMHNTYVFDVEDVGQWTVAVDDGTVTVTEGAGEADCTITASEETLVKIANGEANPTTAYMTGKLKIQGDMGAALKLQKLF